MASSAKQSRPLLAFYLLVVYVLIQLCWWAYMLVELNNEVYQQKEEIVLFRSSNPEETHRMAKEMESKLHKRWLMISSEGTVFLAILGFGIYRVRKSIKQEQELAKQQNNFLLSVTHELKSPIASAKLQMETLLKRELDKDKQKEIIGSAIQDTERLNSLVENILLAARIENSNIQLYREDINLSELIKETITEQVRKFNITHKIRFQVQDALHFHADKFSFITIVNNLFENAVKYSPSSSSITIKLEKTGERINLSIVDEGTGIPEAELKNIFRKFYRIGNEETRKTKGTGLGLFIVQHLAEQNNGTISVKRNEPNGTIFEIVFRGQNKQK